MRTVAIGAIVELAARFRDVSTSPATVIDLEDVDAEVSVRVERVETSWQMGARVDVGTVVIDDAPCTIEAQRAKYAWNTAGLEAGTYRYRFTVRDHSGTRVDIEPATWIPLRLVA